MTFIMIAMAVYAAAWFVLAITDRLSGSTIAADRAADVASPPVFHATPVRKAA